MQQIRAMKKAVAEGHYTTAILDEYLAFLDMACEWEEARGSGLYRQWIRQLRDFLEKDIERHVEL